MSKQMTSCLCTPCQALWNDNPLGVLRRRGMCVECKKIVDDMHVDAVKSSKGFHYKTKIFSAPSTLTATPFESTTEEFHALRATHEDEILNRVRWCLDHGMTPAYDHLHLAHGDDRRFMVIFLSCVFCGVCRLLRFLFPSPH